MTGVRASKIEAAYEALSIYDYFKAKKLFYGELKKSHKAAAAYGLATIYFRTDNPFSNTDSASKFITLAGNYYKTTRLKESYFNYKIDSLSILICADSIAEKSLLKASKTNTVKAYEQFLLANPYATFQQKFNALYLRDELSYKLNLTYNVSDSTKIFMLRFPENYFYNEYYTLFDKQVFEEQTPLKNAEQFNAFISKFPKNKFVGQAQDELFEIYRKNNDLQGLDFYVTNYKNSHFINEAWKLLYALTVKSYNNEELQSFVQNYPEFPFKASINKEIELNNKILILVNDSDYVGFVDTTGKYVILPQYDEATTFKEGLAVVYKNDSVFFINKENQNVFNAFYNDAFTFTYGNAPVKINNQWFLINRQGQKSAGPFQDLSEQSENIYIVKTNNKYGAVDVYGNSIISPQYNRLGDFKNGFAYYLNDGLYGFVTKTGLTSKARYQWISDFDENKIAIVKLDNLYGLINENDSVVLPPQYDLVLKAENNIFITVKNNQYGFFDGKGCFLTGIDFDYKKELPVSFYTNVKLFKLVKKNKQALMDINGRVSIDYDAYEEVNFAQNNLIRIKRKGKYGFVDRKLSLVIPCKYNSATDFNEGLSICVLKQETFLLNLKGETVLKTKGTITPVTNQYYLIKDEEGHRLIDNKGQLVFSNVEGWQLSAKSYLIIELENKSKKIIKL
ncbi:MAG: WG repeat-containing protein [Bacteroidia bacterium]|nr:WG repeat-containing protein [Bacteroidia bacterium]